MRTPSASSLAPEGCYCLDWICLTFSMDTGTISFMVGVMSLKRAAIMLVLAELEWYPLDLLVMISAMMLFKLSTWLMKNSKRDKCIDPLCTLGSTCLDELDLSVRGAKTYIKFL